MYDTIAVRVPAGLRQAIEQQAAAEIDRQQLTGRRTKTAEFIRLLLTEGLEKRGAYEPANGAAKVA